MLVGYGLLFGFGSGLGYGLALAIVATRPSKGRSTAIGLVMAAFAISGVILSIALAGTIGAFPPTKSFFLIGLAIAAVGVVLILALPASIDRDWEDQAAVSHPALTVKDMFRKRFMLLFLAFFFICYDGLMIVGHASGIVAANGLREGVAGLAAGTFTFGYILGSLFGGRLVEALSAGVALIVSNAIAAAGLLILLLSGSANAPDHWTTLGLTAGSCWSSRIRGGD